MTRILAAAFTALLAIPALAADRTPTTFDALLQHYEPIRQALLHDNTEGVAGHASAMATIATEAATQFSPHAAGVKSADGSECVDLLGAVRKDAATLAAAKDLASARAAFWALSGPMIRYREMAGGERPSVVAYCSMEKKKWLQPQGEIGNPYTGQKMARCGEVVSK